MAPLPTPTTTFQTHHHPSPILPVHPRQATITVTPSPSANSDTSSPTDAKTLSGGAIAGIVIGSIAGFLLLLWIIRSCTNLGAPPGEAVPGRPWYGSVRGEGPVREVYEGRRSRSGSRGRRREGYRGGNYERGYGHHGHRHHHRHRSGSRQGEFVGPVVQEAVPAVVVRDEARRRSRSQGYYGEGYEYWESGRSRSRGGY
ncbi:uncharacterized protein C8A04DRAFT_15554 [Dichotomopilus funicola]|uniref:Uncharacterized protein n=1 Tax=Dichotomopilus funicola TaxID=1934379 RepID=A0AAN6UXP8_9PEZI|nr:hypothetical protein C8A04DRAFT_15554 [Dichotomopilus funicola]